MLLYSPLSHIIKAVGEYEGNTPTSMKTLRGRNSGLIALVDSILSNLEKAEGCLVISLWVSCTRLPTSGSGEGFLSGK